MKKTVLFLVVSLFLLSACNPNMRLVSEKTDAGSTVGQNLLDHVEIEAQYSGWTIDQYIEESQNIFLATCTSVSVRKQGAPVGEMTFDVSKVLKGTYDDKVVRFEALSAKYFSVGTEYVLFCGKDANIFNDSVSYGISMQISETESGLTAEGIRDLNMKTIKDVISYVGDYVATHEMKTHPELTGDYCHSEDVFEIYDYSDYVFLAEIIGANDPDIPHDRSYYEIEVKEELKGKYSGEYHVVGFRSSMEVGKTYLLLLKKPDATAWIFTMSSLKSVLPEEDAEAQMILNTYSKKQ